MICVRVTLSEENCMLIKKKKALGEKYSHNLEATEPSGKGIKKKW
jgi:hypothetical protein